eukprot:scaffold4386_cov138-Skeletonema_marinoi.AAC.13
MTRLYLSSAIFTVSLLQLPVVAYANQLPTCEDIGVELNQDSCRQNCSHFGHDYDGVLFVWSDTSSCVCKSMNDNAFETICESQKVSRPATPIIPTLDPTISCKSMGITTSSQCAANCKKYFPDSNSTVNFLEEACHCIQDDNFDNSTFICGAGYNGDYTFTCQQAGVIDGDTCTKRCEPYTTEWTSIPNVTFLGSYHEYLKACECWSIIPNGGVFIYCGRDGPPRPRPVNNPPNLDSCTERWINIQGKLYGISTEDMCNTYCGSDIDNQWNDGSNGEDVSCICSNGAGCADPASSPPSASGSNSLVVWTSSFVVLLTTVFVAALS